MDAYMNWEQHRFTPVECVFQPRESYEGRGLMPELAAHAGEVIEVIALWKMDDDDPYPGEWAIGAADRRSDILGRGWIASGDFVPVNGT